VPRRGPLERERRVSWASSGVTDGIREGHGEATSMAPVVIGSKRRTPNPLVIRLALLWSDAKRHVLTDLIIGSIGRTHRGYAFDGGLDPYRQVITMAGKRSGRSIPMTPDASRRIQSRGDSTPDSRTARTGFGRRAQSAAARRRPK
jgi:hypothetical protein